MVLELYYMPESSPCRAVMLTAKAIDVQLDLKLVDLEKGENMAPTFVAMNPQHTVPTLNDDGFVLWESRAIMTYLVNRYGKDDKLYPKDPKQRAVVDQRLYFDMGTLYQRLGDYVYPPVFEGQTLDEEKLKKCVEALGWLEEFILKSGGKYCAGEHLTLADVAIVASVSTMEPVGLVDLSAYKNVRKWLERCKKEIPGYQEVSKDGIDSWVKYAKSKLEKV
ncbi:unnamed protein product [Darwinula stevensoni]|uniref:Glutathione S-transferase n=1 Tax=Darwinula stevensoni TaxID=69355 RepID=A0A7R9ADN9_9CRUS|nr:unnamed protein product [Darwinula stevensoni]CAG0901497.1 unnamed protein product [Darwinula stevensoni]